MNSATPIAGFAPQLHLFLTLERLIALSRDEAVRKSARFCVGRCCLRRNPYAPIGERPSLAPHPHACTINTVLAVVLSRGQISYGDRGPRLLPSDFTGKTTNYAILVFNEKTPPGVSAPIQGERTKRVEVRGFGGSRIRAVSTSTVCRCCDWKIKRRANSIVGDVLDTLRIWKCILFLSFR